MTGPSDAAINMPDLQRRAYELMLQDKAVAALALVDATFAGRDLDAEMHLLRGETLMQLPSLDEALAAFRRARDLDPSNVRAWAHEGAALMRLQRVEEAVAAFDQGLKLAPRAHGAWYNRGFAYAHLNRTAEAIADFDQALDLAADSGAARVNRAMALLRIGRYREGFAELEARFSVEPGTRELRQYRQQRWRKGNAIAGKRILLYAEQGIGDVVQFARFIPQVAAKAAHVTLEVQPAVVRLLKTLPCEVVAFGAQVAPFNLHSPLVSLGTLLDVQLETIPAQVPYLTAPDDDVARWRSKLAAHGGALKVGLAWSGNPQHKNDYNRSVRFEQLAPLLNVPGVMFVSLQKDVRGTDAEALRAANILDAGKELGDFADTAALVEALDIVISVDTAVAHVGGALGKPIWVLLPFAPDWRWMLERSDSPWYPSARLFRQASLGDWTAPIEAVRRDLTAAAGTR